MREYSKIAPQFWIGSTGKKLRKLGTNAQLVALYLLTSPHSNMIGMYHLPVAYLSADTGIPLEGASEALRSLIEAGFCAYDEASEVVWVHEMARFQVGEALKPTDKQCAGTQNAYDQVPDNIYLPEFYEKYSEAYHLTTKRFPEDGSPLEAPSETLRSKEKEKEKEKEREEKSAEPRFSALGFLVEAGADKKLAKDWLAVRAKKKLASTETALDEFVQEVLASGKSIDEILRHCCVKGWGGFEAGWMKNQRNAIKADEDVFAGCI